MRFRLAMAVCAIANPSFAYEATGWRKDALELVRKEKQVVEAMWSQEISLWVSMRDNGTNRTGFADYLCLLLFDAGRTASDKDFTIVKVLDAAALARGELVELGQSVCPYQ